VGNFILLNPYSNRDNLQKDEVGQDCVKEPGDWEILWKHNENVYHNWNKSGFLQIPTKLF